VIRDILHRISERWPCRVIVWPVVVQGDQAAAQVSAAIAGFGALAPGGAVPRPDLIIVARGGGSVEDLWPFNDEALARAAAASPIPLISAVGHETDTTLIDFVSDRRAPTPTAAAEIATPVLADLAAALAERERRMVSSARNHLDRRRARLAAAQARLPRLTDVLALATQRLDIASGRLGAALGANVAAHRHDLTMTSASLKPRLLQQTVGAKSRALEAVSRRLAPLTLRTLASAAERLAMLEKLRRSRDPDGPLVRGFARVERDSGALVRSAASLKAGEAVALVFHDGRRGAVIPGPPAPRRSPTPASEQGHLFASSQES
jgi:exodeoxyribonuclease VII large subunit